MRLAHLLDGLRCADCRTLDVLWYDPVRGLVECSECGHRTHLALENTGNVEDAWEVV